MNFILTFADYTGTKLPKANCLYSAKNGTRVQVLEIPAAAAAARQLASRGIRVHAILEVKHTAPLGGPILVEHNGSTMAIGRTLARKIVVKILP